MQISNFACSLPSILKVNNGITGEQRHVFFLHLWIASFSGALWLIMRNDFSVTFGKLKKETERTEKSRKEHYRKFINWKIRQSWCGSYRFHQQVRQSSKAALLVVNCLVQTVDHANHLFNECRALLQWGSHAILMVRTSLSKYMNVKNPINYLVKIQRTLNFWHFDRSINKVAGCLQNL